MSTMEVSRAQNMEDQLNFLQVQAKVMEQEKQNQAAKVNKMEKKLEDMGRKLETQMTSQATMTENYIRHMDQMQRTMKRLQEDNMENARHMEQMQRTMNRLQDENMENARHMEQMQRTMNRLRDEKMFYRQLSEEKEELIRKFIKDKHDEIEAITLKYEAELVARDRVLEAFVKRNRHLERTVKDMEALLKAAGIDAGAAVVIGLVGGVCALPALSIGCAVGAAGLGLDSIRNLYNAYTA